MQPRSDGEGRRSSRPFTSPTQHPLASPSGSPRHSPALGALLPAAAFRFFPVAAPVTSAQPRRDLPLCCAARVPLAPRSRPALSPRPAGMPGPGPQLSRVAWTRARDAPLSRPRPPLGLEDPYFLQSPHGSPRLSGCPRRSRPGIPRPHLSPLETLPFRRLHPRSDPAPAQHFGQGVGHLLHGAGHPVHVAPRSGVWGPRPPRDPHGAVRPARPAGIRR